jgi:hypothetical protein
MLLLHQFLMTVLCCHTEYGCLTAGRTGDAGSQVAASTLLSQQSHAAFLGAAPEWIHAGITKVAF